MRQLVKKTLPEKVMESLENEIILGKYAIGDKVPSEPELIEYFKVSRNSIREAMQSLIHAGILEAKQGRGTYVVATSRLQVEMKKFWNQCDFEDINEFRILLGRFIVKLASKRRSALEAKILEEKAIQLKDCIKNIGHIPKEYLESHNLLEDSDNQNSESVKVQNIRKNKKKDIVSNIPSKEVLTQENIGSAILDISLLQSLDYEYTMALIQGAHNNVMVPLFVSLQKEYIEHTVKDNREIWENNIKLYGQLAVAIKSKDTKAIKKNIDILYN